MPLCTCWCKWTHCRTQCMSNTHRLPKCISLNCFLKRSGHMFQKVRQPPHLLKQLFLWLSIDVPAFMRHQRNCRPSAQPGGLSPKHKPSTALASFENTRWNFKHKSILITQNLLHCSLCPGVLLLTGVLVHFPTSSAPALDVFYSNAR